MNKLQNEFENYYCTKYKLPMFVVRDFRKMPGYFEKKSKWLEQKLEEKNIKIDNTITDEIMKYQATKSTTQMVKEVDRCRNSIIALEILQQRIKENK
jgi:hypothetical protein